VGGAVAEYLDPLDGPAWIRAVDEYAAPGSARRAAQVAGWQAPQWEEHMRQALAFVEDIAADLDMADYASS